MAAFTAVGARWRQLAPRERRLILAGTGLLLATLIYLYLLEPMVTARERLTETLPGLRAQVVAMRLQAAEVERLRASPVPALPPGGVRAAIEASARAYGLTGRLKRLREGGRRLAQADFEAVAFDLWVRWVAQLQTQYGVRLESCRVQGRRENGTVDVSAVFSAA